MAKIKFEAPVVEINVKPYPVTAGRSRT